MATDNKRKGPKCYPNSRIANKGGTFKVVWPGGERMVAFASLAERLDTLAGKTIGELWDFLFRGDEIFSILEEALRKRYPGIQFVKYTLFGSTHGGEEKGVIEHLPALLKEHGCDAVISAVGC